MRTRTCVLSVFFGVLLAYLPLWGATQNALVTGSVYDQKNGGPLAGATVRLLNAGSGFSQSRKTDDSGSFTFATVPPGDGYVLSAEMSGFETAIREDLVFNVADNTLILPPFLLQAIAQPAPEIAAPPATAATAPTTQPAAQPEAKPENQPEAKPETQPSQPSTQPEQPSGQPGQAAPGQAKVGVSARVALAPGAASPQPRPTRAATISLDLVSTTLSGVVDSRSVRALPLRNRDFLDLALLVPGVYSVEQGSELQGASIVVNGSRANMHNFLLDGVDNNDVTINQSLPFQIVEAMQEFRVQTSTSTAEYGRSGGAQINTISRRGLNTVHGGLFEFHRNSALSPDGPISVYAGGGFDRFGGFERQFGVDPFSDPTLYKLYNRRDPHVVLNQFGANVGGALKKNKAFGFLNWESFRVSNPRPVFEGAPPTVLRSAAFCAGTFGVTCNPNALALYNLYPASNVPNTNFTDNVGGPAFFVGESANRSESDNYLGRLDWQKSERVSMSFKHNVQRIHQIQGGSVAGTANYSGDGAEAQGRNQNFSYNLVHQYTRASNELRLGWDRFRLNLLALDRGLNPTKFGFQNLNFTNGGLPTFALGAPIPFVINFPSLGSSLGAPNARANNTWSLSDGIGILRGRHNWKLGGEARYTRLNILNQAFGRGTLSSELVGNPAAGTPPFSSLGFTGIGFSDFASIARVSSQFGGGFDRYFRTRSFAGFFQDQWRRSNFTLNYGLRYEVNTAPVELHDRLVNYYPAFGGLVRSGGTGVFDPFNNAVVDVSGNPVKASHPVPKAGFDTDMKNFGPRFGFAWDPRKKGKTALRAGYALVFDQEPLEPSVNMLLNPPYVRQDLAVFPYQGDIFSACDPAVSSGPSCLSSPASSAGSNDIWFSFPYSINARDPKTRTSYVHQFNFGIEQKVGAAGLFDAAYVGSVGHKLSRLRDLNPCTPSLVFRFLSGVPTAQCTGTFRSTEIVNQENAANSSFHSLLLRLQTRAYRGFQMDAHYEFAKSIDDAPSVQPRTYLFSTFYATLISSFFGIDPTRLLGHTSFSPTLSLQPELPIITTRASLPQDSTNLRLERGRSDFDVQHRFVLNFTYDVPKTDRLRGFGRGWQLATITTVQGGQPYSVFLDFSGLPLRPNLRRAPRIKNSDIQSAIENQEPLGTFTVNSAGIPSFVINPNSPFDVTPNLSLKPGNLGRNTFTGPRLSDVDFSVVKNNYLGRGERRNLQFRVEIFNLTDTANFRMPYSSAGTVATGFYCVPSATSSCASLQAVSSIAPDPLFGRILQSRPPTEVQFALKLLF